MSTAASPKAEPPATTRGNGFAPAWYVPPGLAAAPAGAATGDGTDDDTRAPRRWRLLMAARLLIALALLVLQVNAWRSSAASLWLVGLCAALVGLAMASFAWPPPGPTAPPRASRPLSLLWLLTAWSDLAVIAVLQWVGAGGVSYVPLFVWPVLLAAVTGPRLLALGLAAAATLVLLAQSWRSLGGLGSSEGLQAAIAGTGLLATAWLASQLTARLDRAQAAALRSRQLAQLHSRINNVIAAGLSEGVVVLDADGHPWYANPAAERMLLGTADTGGTDTASAATLRQSPAWGALVHWVHNTLAPLPAAANPPAAVLERTLDLPLGDRRLRRIHARLHPIISDAGQRLAVLMLEDTHAVEQRLHTERLATMGRVTAAVAHEIRNPLAAIAQASALLAEDDPSPAQRPLLAMIEQNVQRLDRTVNDVLEAVRLPSAAAGIEAVPLDATVNTIVQDWLHQHPQGDRLQWLPGARHTHVLFDPEHLRRVLVNLLDNADRYASTARGAIRVETRLLGAQALLTVWSEGAEIPPAVREHLFEPFTSAHPRSSGLGLYLSRELCRRYHAKLRYERSLRGQRAGNAFVVRLPLG